MTGGVVSVRKTRAMIATEIAHAVGAPEWEEERLRLLSLPTLEGIARRVVGPTWSSTATVDLRPKP